MQRDSTPTIITVSVDRSDGAVPPPGTHCCALMTIGSRRGRGKKKGSYTVHGRAKRLPCPNLATRYAGGTPYCNSHGPSKFRIDPYYETPAWRHLRQQTLKRDHATCQYCGAPAHQADHVIPRGHSGADALENLVACCRDCNKIAAGTRFDDFAAKKAWILAARKRITAAKNDRRPTGLLNAVVDEL